MSGRKQFRFIVRDNGCWECFSHCQAKGYPSTQKNKKTVSVARYLYEKQFGDLPPGQLIRHKCDNTLCINPWHLEIGTQADNMKDRNERGHSPKGERNGRARLTTEQVRDIKKRLPQEGDRYLAFDYRVSLGTIRSIRNGSNWGWLD